LLPELDVTGSAETTICAFISVSERTRIAVTAAIYCLLRRFAVNIVLSALEFLLLPAPEHDARPSHSEKTRENNNGYSNGANPGIAIPGAK